MTDENIVELIRTGRNDRALDALYKNFPSIKRMIRANGGNADDAQDIFQEALIILVNKIRNTSFLLTARLSTYLFGVSRLLWKDELRKRNSSFTRSLDVPDADNIEAVISDAIEEERIAMLAGKALEELKGRCRELLLLFYEGRLKMKDIAVKMGYSSENTAKNQKYKCLEAAKNRLKELKQTAQIF
jgi:RNA polymerase sigma factor (sigma-70 family)